MYDGLQSPGRNDECWCGSGKKYKKCHLDFDERLEELAEAGEEVPPRDLLKTPAEIEGIKRSAEVNIGVLDYVAERIAPGVTTEQIDQWVHDYTVEHGAIPAPLDYEGFPKSVCTSVNEVVCHGIGLEFHEDPFVSFVTEAGTGPILVPGLCFTIEPMINAGAQEIDMTDPNGWTVRTADRSLTAQWEVQLVITEDGYELLSW